MIRFSFGASKITNFYTYCTALVHGFLIQTEGEEHEYLYDKLKCFIERNSYHMDNHICFTTDNGMNYMWSDGNLTIDNLTIKNW